MRHFDIEGWEDFDGERRPGQPSRIEGLGSDIDSVWGLLVHVYDDKDPEFHHYFWAWTLDPQEDWENWWSYIDSMMEMYGIQA